MFDHQTRTNEAKLIFKVGEKISHLKCFPRPSAAVLASTNWSWDAYHLVGENGIWTILVRAEVLQISSDFTTKTCEQYIQWLTNRCRCGKRNNRYDLEGARHMSRDVSDGGRRGWLPSVDKQLRLNNWKWSRRNENGDESLVFFGYGTNPEIVILEAFKRRDIIEWLDAIESYPEGIYKWRWGERKIWLTFRPLYSLYNTSRWCAPEICHCTNVLRRREGYRTTLRHQVYPGMNTNKVVHVCH